MASREEKISKDFESTVFMCEMQGHHDTQVHQVCEHTLQLGF